MKLWNLNRHRQKSIHSEIGILWSWKMVPVIIVNVLWHDLQQYLLTPLRVLPYPVYSSCPQYGHLWGSYELRSSDSSVSVNAMCLFAYRASTFLSMKCCSSVASASPVQGVVLLESVIKNSLFMCGSPKWKVDLADWTTTSTCQPHPQFIKYHYRTSFALFYQHCANMDFIFFNEVDIIRYSISKHPCTTTSFHLPTQIE